MKIPVVISHFNSAPHYLEYALRSAAKFDQETVFMGDNKNQHVWENFWNSEKISSKKHEKFKEVYVKMSDYSKAYEDGFWKRMFFLEDWMVTSKTDKVILLDSDIVTFANYGRDIYPLLPEDCYSALVIAEQSGKYVWAASTHCSYWTIDGIQDFTNYCIDTYANKNNVMAKLKEKYAWHLENSMPGGICEMTLLYFWSLNNRRVFNFADPRQGIVADHKIKSATNRHENEYILRLGVKRFTFKDGLPYAFNKKQNRNIRFLCIHCQGSAKPGMQYLAGRLKFLYASVIFAHTKSLKLKATTKKIISNIFHPRR